MHRLMLLRHAKSSWSSPGMQDAARPLNGRGEAAARLMGGYMARHSLLPDRVLCSPHNPGLQEAAELLIAAGDVELRERLREKFPTAALAVIDFTIDKWSSMHERSGRLDRYITPRSIAAATN